MIQVLVCNDGVVDCPLTMFLGLSQDTWLIVAVSLLGLSGVRFLWVWWSGFLGDRKAGKPVEYPWE